MDSSLVDSKDISVSELSDEAVNELAALQMDNQKSKRLSELLDMQQAGDFNEKGKQELEELMQIYEYCLLRKAQAMNEAVRRKLLEPLSP